MTTALVLGGTGKTGRRIVAQLAAGGHTARAAARTPGPASAGVEPTRFDWDDPTTHDLALKGADAVYIVPPAQRSDYVPLVGRLARQAVNAGSRRVVLLTARGVDKAPPNPQRQAEEEIEREVVAGGAEWAVIRPSFFAQDFTEAFLRPDIDAADAVIAPTGNGAEPWIDAEDIAAVAVAVLTGAAAANQAYDLSGPALLTLAEAAEVLSRHVGRELRHVDPTPEQWQQGAEASGVSPAYAARLSALFKLIRDGRDAYLSDGVRRALGRPPTSFEDWAAREASALRR